MFDRIAIPLDGSELADRVLGPVRRLLQAGRREVVLVRVVPGFEEPDPAARDAALAHLEPVRDRLASELDGATLHVQLLWGDPAAKLLQYVEDTRPDLVAMATHGRSGLTRLTRGSVAERVLRRCPAPLLLCNPRVLEATSEAPFKRILVPLDGSELADEVLPLVEALALAYEAEVTLVGIEPVVTSAIPLPEELPEGTAWNPERIEKDLRARRRRLEAAGVTTRLASSYGVEAEEILKAARNADLVAMTTHGRSGFSRWWFGSVAEQVLRHCPVPVLVRRTGGRAS